MTCNADLIAEALAEFVPGTDYDDYAGGTKPQRMRRMIAYQLADVLETTNDSFDRDKFLEAARIEA